MGQPVRLGSLCTGYGGLEMAAQALFDAELDWVADNDPAVATLLEERMPGIPNYGDITTANPPSVDVLAAGFPCQPLSGAGRRKGTEDDRWLWPAIEALIGRMEPRPRLLLFENVPGLLTINGGNAMAIKRHARLVEAPPPSPVTDKGQLSPAFVEWMMTLPPGWVTELDLPRTVQLKILGNGVLPIQAETAYRSLLAG